MKKVYFFFVPVLLLIIFLIVIQIGVIPKPILQTNSRLQVVASFYPMYFFASQIGGDKASVTNITPATSEPHDYEPTTQDIARITTSQMLVLNGGQLEPWGIKIKDQLAGTGVVTIIASENLASQQLTEDGKTIQDPHIWLNPILAKKEVAAIEHGYEIIDPKDSHYFQTNQQTLDYQLDALDTAYSSGLSHCQRKDFVTSHAAFGYLAAQYGLTQISLSGISPDQEPTAQKLAQISDLVRSEHMPYIFFERLVSPKLSETIATETGAKTLVLDPIEGVTATDRQNNKTYFTIMKDNLSHLELALQCNQ